MEETLNTPYVKKYNDKGELLNPIDGYYLTIGPNRRERRKPLQKKNKKNLHWQVGDKLISLD